MVVRHNAGWGERERERGKGVKDKGKMKEGK